MYIDYKLEGKYVTLRSVEESDAEFTLSLRQDPLLTKYIPYLNISLEQQINWIKQQRVKIGDYYFAVINKEDKRVGVVGVYDIKDNHAETGRVVIRGNALESIEAQYLLYNFCFVDLGLDYTTDYRLADNKAAIRSAAFFGADLSEPYEGEDGNDHIDGCLFKKSFIENKNRIERILYRI